MDDNQNNINFYNTNNNQDSVIPSIDEGSILEAPMAPPADEEVAEMPETPPAPEIPVAATISEIPETPSAPEVPETPSAPVVNETPVVEKPATNTDDEVKKQEVKEDFAAQSVNNSNSREISVNDESISPLEAAYAREKKKKPSSTFILLLILVIFIFLFKDRLIEFFTNLSIPSPNGDIQEPLVTPSDDIITPSDDVVTPSDEDEKTEEKVPTPPVELNWNGVYVNGNNSIKIYKISDSEIYYSTIGDSYSSGFLDLSNNNAKKEFFGDTTSFTLDGNTINVTSTSDFIIGGTYIKKSDYSENNCYEDNIGELKYINSNLNGIFKKDDIVIKIFQSKVDTGRIIITKSNSQYSKEFKIVDGKIELNDQSFGETEKINAEISGSTLTITASETDSSGLLNQISGTYTKSSSYSLSDILDDNLY